MVRTAVIALGGNAFTREKQRGEHAEMAANARVMAEGVHSLRQQGWRVAVAHGNGPQVGNLAIQQDAAADRVPSMPLHALVAMTQGLLGSLFDLALHEVTGGRTLDVVSVVTHVAVNPADAAFDRPTKPTGPFVSAAAAEDLARDKGWVFAEDSGRGYRRVVPSPTPLEIVEARAIARLIEDGFVVVAAGGGGIPVAAHNGGLTGVAAVIDKDLTAALLATAIRAQALVLVTDVDSVMLDFGTPGQRPISTIGADEMRRHLADGQFPDGSMGPKVRAALQFLDGGGSCAVITRPQLVAGVLADRAAPGTRILATVTNRGTAS
ncbi:MAG TPA: carbamate kinase [Pilimelia sp.]|nr:carbamate kinase [Pilimelia sp.]